MVYHFSLKDAILQPFMKGYRENKGLEMTIHSSQGVHYWAAEKQMNIFLFVLVLYVRNKQRTFWIQE